MMQNNEQVSPEQISPLFFILCGPTGSGKTDISYKMAEQFPFEIVNGDTGQCYEPLTIGTAKPIWKNHPVTHHLFDSISEPRYFSVTEYRDRMQNIMQDIWQRKKIPLIVGGSLFYIRSLFWPPYLASSYVKTSEDNEAGFVPSEVEGQDLWQQLYEIDPARAQAIDKHDRYRIERALIIWHTTGQKPSEQKPIYQPLGQQSLGQQSLVKFFLTYVTRDRQELYDRINQRTHLMMEQG